MGLRIEVEDLRMYDIIDKEQAYNLLASSKDGLIFTEGPVWNAIDASFIFSDIAGNKMYRWSEEDGLKEWVNYSFKANGNAYDQTTGQFITCEHATSRIVSRNKEGKDYTIVCSHYKDKELNSPNDIIVKKDGTIYFTDPHFGRNPSKVGVERKKQLDFQGIYKYAKGTLTVLDDSLTAPNGLCFNLDETKLFVNDSPEKSIWVFDMMPSGELTNKRLWATVTGDGLGLPDGMKIDNEGNVYCCAQGGIHVFDQNGTKLGRIVFEGQVANFTFGGKDGKTLFICAADCIYSLKGKICGVR